MASTSLHDTVATDGDSRGIPGIRLTVADMSAPQSQQGLRTYVTTSFPLRLGRSALNDVVLDASTVSEWHGAVVSAGGQLVLRELGATNCILLNGRPVTGDVVLRSRDRLVIWPFRVDVERTGLPEVARDDLAGASAGEAVPGERASGGPSDVAARLRRLRRVLDGAAEAGLAKPEDVALLGRLHDVLRVLGAAGLGMLRAHDELNRAVGFRAPVAALPPGVLTGVSALLCHVLDVERSAADTVTGLDAALGGVLRHQAALPRAVVSGVRALLQSVSPDACDEEARRVPWWRGRARARNAVWQRRHREMLADDRRVFGAVFGPEAAAAYGAAIDVERRDPLI